MLINYTNFYYTKIKKKFRVISSDNNNKEKDKLNSTNIDQISLTPFKTAVDKINKIEHEYSPREKFDTLMEAFLELKTAVLDVTNGKSELESLDDELPLTIYLVSQIKLKNPSAEVCILDDYFRYSKDCIDKESKILTTFKVN